MGFITGTPLPVDPATFLEVPYRERIRVLARHWVDHGNGLPGFVMLIYIVKMAFFAVAGVLACTLTSHLSARDIAGWWDTPIVYQKLVVWTMLVEVLGIGGAWGPLCGHFKPMTAGVRYWVRPGTIRLPPWPDTVPGTAGDARTAFDVALYLALIAGLVVAIALPGTHDASLTAAVGQNKGLITPAVLISIMVLLVIVGLRDKTIFLAARSEQWLPALVFFAFFSFVDMIVAAKLLIVIVWLCAGVSKVNRHFEHVIPPMVSNTPWNPITAAKRLQYEDFPNDLRPSATAKFLAHAGGAIGELIPPWVLLFSHNPTLSAVAAIFMVCYHTFIISTFPLAVPLEWNLMFIYITAFLFLGFPNHDGFGLGDMNAGLLIVTVAGLLVFPILGEVRPQLVSFLPSLRQYSGNWATSMWGFAPGTEAKLSEHLVLAAPLHKSQLAAMYDEDTAEEMLHQYLGWRAMHSQGRGLNSVMLTQLGADIDRYVLREGEILANLIVGWNFGDGHLHGERLVTAVQARCQYAPGELIVVFAESEPIGNGRQQYWVMDATFGVVERGSWAVGDAVAAQPWLPEGPIPLELHWRTPGYERVRPSAI